MLVSLCRTGTSMSAVADACVKSFVFINFSQSNAIDTRTKMKAIENTLTDSSNALL